MFFIIKIMEEKHKDFTVKVLKSLVLLLTLIFHTLEQVQMVFAAVVAMALGVWK